MFDWIELSPLAMGFFVICFLMFLSFLWALLAVFGIKKLLSEQIQLLKMIAKVQDGK